jgi:hypothetical protein
MEEFELVYFCDAQWRIYCNTNSLEDLAIIGKFDSFIETCKRWNYKMVDYLINTGLIKDFRTYYTSQKYLLF